MSAVVVPDTTGKEEKITTAILGYSWTSSLAQSFALFALGLCVWTQITSNAGAYKHNASNVFRFISGFILMAAAALSSVMTAELFKTKSLTYKV